MPTNRIAVFYPSGHLNIAPSIHSTVICLANSGFYVDFFTVRNTATTEIVIGKPGVITRFFPISVNTVKEPRRIITLGFMLWALFACRRRYACVIAGGIRGLFAATLTSKVHGIPVVDYNLELYVGPKLNTRLASLVKFLERKCIQSASFSVIQDEVRAQILMQDAHIDRSRIELVPNSPLGKASLRRTNFLHKRLNLDDSACILLHAGSVNQAFMVQELVTAAQSLPANWKCVVHSALHIGLNDPYFQLLQKANTNHKVCFSLDPVPFFQLDDLVSSATVGVALYGEAGGVNTTSVGMASGKIAQYLRNGLPVIVSDYPSLREIIERFNCGILLSDPSDLPTAVHEIMEDYDTFCSNAVRCFNEVFSFESAFESVVNRIKDLSGC